MASVGERLKVERETRNTSIEEMVVATGIGQSYLEALEKDEIHELPGKAFGKLYIRAYAEVFGFDPQPWIDDYDREQRAAAGASTEPTAPAPAGSRPVAAAIAQWKAARAVAGQAEPAAEDVVDVAVIADVEPVEARDAVEVIVSEPAVPEPEAPVAEPIVPAAVIVHPNVRVPAARRPIAPFVLLGVVAIASAIYFGTRGTGGGESAKPTGSAPASATPRPVQPALETRPPEPPPPVIAKPATRPPTNAPVVRTESGTSDLSVPEFGVGRRIVNLKLEGESDRFAPGDRVCFSTRVLFGQRGQVIRHVWIYAGRTQQTITLRLGSPDWRTHTNKTLGHAGSWAVEARDDKGRVLARVAFACVTGSP